MSHAFVYSRKHLNMKGLLSSYACIHGILLMGNVVSVASPIFANWSTKECQGPPNSIYQFSAIDLSGKYGYFEYETWPTIFRYFLFLEANFKPGQCSVGKYPPIDSYKCCSTLLRSDMPTGVSSVNMELLTAPLTNIPTSENAVNYCHLKRLTASQNWYSDAYIREGVCADGLFCNTSGYFTHFQSGTCNDISKGVRTFPQLYEIPGNFVMYYLEKASGKSRNVTINASFYKMQEAQLNFEWQEYLPKSYHVFEYDDIWEYVSIISAGLTFIIIIATMSIIDMRIYKRLLAADIYHLMGQILWLVVLGLKVAYLHIIFVDVGPLKSYIALVLALNKFATFFTSMHCLVIVVYAAGLDEATNRRLLVTFCLLHIAL
jgi:hypothetical protein